ncbi:TspO/MBR-related protein [Dillenia turbinata]|uniref:TspO/MBR-related protein n=1 Tax=Dillenia turbinata TaxID=194707 RepID=A0AAN8VNQ0_9MAGN
MASETDQTLRHRVKDESDKDATVDNDNTKMKRAKRMAIAKGGLKSISIAILLPLLLSFSSIYFFGDSEHYRSLAKPFWFPPLWALHATSLAMSVLMGLSGWFVWVDGGFHRDLWALSVFLAQLGLSLAWHPVLFWFNANQAGLVISLVHFGSLIGCLTLFRKVNPLAADLVLPCLAWVGFLAIVNIQLLYL